MENQIRRRRSCNTDVKATEEIKTSKSNPALYSELRLLFDVFSDKPISYFPIYAKITNSVTAGVLLAQIIYWGKRYPEFYKTDEEFCEELAMGLYELKSAKIKLQKMGFVEIKRKSIPAKTYYTINLDFIIQYITSYRKNPELVSGKTNNLYQEKPITNITEITSEITSENNIYTRFLDEWNKNKIIIHKKITSKRKTVIDKILKLNDYPQEEIFKSFQNYATVLQSPDYFWDYTWSMEDFLKRGLDRFVDEAQPLSIFKNKFKNQTNSQPPKQIQKSNPTRKSLNLFSNEKIEDWVEEYESLTNLLATADIWPPNYSPDKDKIYSALLEIKNWKNNMIHTDYSQVRRVTGSVRIICNNYIDWIDRQSWLDDGIKEGSLFPSSKMFKQHFIPDLEGDILDIALRSKGWGRDEDLRMESVMEIEARKKQEAEHKREQKETERINTENRNENILWMYSCMKRHLLDLEYSGIIDISKWQDDLNKSEFEKAVIAIEKKHQEEPTNRGNSYRFLFSRTN